MTVIFYQEDDGTVPVKEWIESQREKVCDKCETYIGMLEERGYELHRPHADNLRDGIRELRPSLQGVHYRILYFFHERGAVLANATVKEDRMPPREIEKAKERREKFEKAPDKYTYDPE